MISPKSKINTFQTIGDLVAGKCTDNIDRQCAPKLGGGGGNQTGTPIPTGGSSGGKTCNGKNCYKLTGRPNCPSTDAGEKPLGTSNCNGVTVRVNHNNCPNTNCLE